MSALLTTIAGDIPGLLRKWSPVLVTIDSDKPPVRGVVLDPTIEPDEPDLRCLVWNERNGRDNKAAMFVCLDLTDPTGRAHAAAYAICRAMDREMSTEERQCVRYALDWAEMHPDEIDTFARLVLRLAGRTP